MGESPRLARGGRYSLWYSVGGLQGEEGTACGIVWGGVPGWQGEEGTACGIVWGEVPGWQGEEGIQPVV